MADASTAVHNVIIIGSGPAGLTAALYAARATLEPLVISGFDLGGPKGGQLMLTTDIENFPGYPDGITGTGLIDDFLAQAERFDTKLADNVDITRVDFSKRPFTLYGEDKLEGADVAYKAKSVIIATGASANYLGLDSEREFFNRGVSACATCDGAMPIFRDKPIAVVGGGDTACEEAMYLTKFGSMVHIIHRRDELRASKIMRQRVAEHPKIKVEWNNVVTEVVGKQFVTGIKLRNTKDDSERLLEVSGMFLGIGHTPNTSVFKGHVDLDEKGYMKVKDRGTYTSVEGVFAAGDVADSVYRQAISAAGTGCMAAIDAERWLEAQEA